MKVLVVALVLSSSSVSAGSKAKGARWVLSAFITGAISGAVSAEIADRYKVRKSMIRNEKFINHLNVTGISRDGKLVSVPSGNYRIILDDINDQDNRFIIIENKSIDDLTAVFISDEA